jgi:pyridinium-3,5-bisthiocarboxylic acid mononucleotide nickel chelatase
MTTAYFDCIGGISGDMTLAALIAAGADVEQLREGLRTLGLTGWELLVSDVTRQGIAATDVEVRVEGTSGRQARTRSHAHDHAPGVSHSHDHGHADHAHGTSGHAPADHANQPRHLAEIVRRIDGSALPSVVKERAVAVFTRLGEVEAKMHGTTIDQVHFHEVGAVDSIVDIVGSVFALHLLGVERIVCSSLPTGHGFVRAAHGFLPVPAPATLELLKGAPLRPVEIEGEMVTPTGAALMSTLAAAFGPMPAMRVRAIGYGAGKKEFSIPNLLRVSIGEAGASGDQPATMVTLIETNLDDLNPQLYEPVMEALFTAGALDVFLTPIQMKKNRPAILLSVLCEPERVAAMTDILFAETSTLGVRTSTWSRFCLEREWMETKTEWGSVRVKVARQAGELRNLAPEFEDCRRVAAAAGVPIKDVQAAALEAARRSLKR